MGGFSIGELSVLRTEYVFADGVNFLSKKNIQILVHEITHSRSYTLFLETEYSGRIIKFLAIDGGPDLSKALHFLYRRFLRSDEVEATMSSNSDIRFRDFLIQTKWLKRLKDRIEKDEIPFLLDAEENAYFHLKETDIPEMAIIVPLPTRLAEGDVDNPDLKTFLIQVLNLRIQELEKISVLVGPAE